MTDTAAERLLHTIRVMAQCVAIVAPISMRAREELLRHASTLLLAHACHPTNPDNSGGARDAPAHQGSLPAAAQTDAALPVNPCPGAASTSAAAVYEGKAADPAPPRTPRTPRKWTGERKGLIRALWLTHGVAEITSRVNALAGEPVTPVEVHSYALARLDLPGRRQAAPPPPAALARPVGEPSVAQRQLAEQAAEAASAPADYRTIRDWGLANGVDVSGQGPSAAVVARVNAARAAHGLPPFRLVNRPADADERRASADDGVAGGPQPPARIRAWARAHGVTIRDAGRLAELDLRRVNAARRLLDLAPFELAR